MKSFLHIIFLLVNIKDCLSFANSDYFAFRDLYKKAKASPNCSRNHLPLTDLASELTMT